MPAVQSSAAPGNPIDDRPPIVPSPGVAEPFRRLRPTVFDRLAVRPAIWDEHRDRGFAVTHPYVRRYWTPVLGPGAVADLLRLATAAARNRPLPRPIHLTELAKVGFVRMTHGALLVRTHVPAVPPALQRRLPPRLRRELRSYPRMPEPSSSGDSRTE